MTDFKDSLLKPDRTEAMLRQAAQADVAQRQAMFQKVQAHVQVAAMVFAQALGPRLKDLLGGQVEADLPDTGALKLLAKQALRCAIAFHQGIDGENIP
jgi:hypothetical protein